MMSSATDRCHRKGAHDESHLDDVLAQWVQFWIQRGWSLTAIARAMRNVSAGLELLSRIDGAPQ
jgi:hypothetical protein